MKIKPYIGVPNLGTIHTDLVRFLMARAVEGFTVNTQIQTGHDVARNKIVKGFLESDSTHLWWIDSDISVAENFIELFKADRDVVIGSYPIRQDGKFCGCFKLLEGGDEIDNLVEVERMGLGMCVIKRQVVQDIVDKHGMFCETQIMKDGLCNKTEDIVAGEWMRELGYKIWIHKEVQCGHIKQIDFRNITNLNFN